MQAAAMEWWWVLLPIWAIAGIGFAGLFLWTENRTSDSDDLLVNIFVSMLIAVGAPLVVLFCIAVALSMLIRGEIPLTTHRLWGKAPANRNSTLVEMIALRRRSDPNLKDMPHPEKWIIADLWRTAEAAVLEIVELASLLKFDGFTEEEIIERIEAWRSATVERPELPPSDIDSYVRYRVECEAPRYPLDNKKLFARTLEIAKAYAEVSTKSSAAEDSVPREWLEERISLIELDRKLIEMQRIPGGPGGLFLSPKKDEMARIKLRMRKEDELWIYESPPETWINLGGRRGVALVRDGKPIENIVLSMN
ncbi:MAG: hypothetical protein JJ959_08080 [Nisaea sp.]|uniref:hypothetical protein n=1 Tax=Nisaea sp. TaxID=2024842 RepID=UPI001B2B52E6|nr:hypothetical protein [Nisaea sp.]MBO6560479.1 hypothetical protein [Nisaea sp.]